MSDSPPPLSRLFLPKIKPMGDVESNSLMRKSEALYDLCDMCQAAIGNQLHSRITAAALTMCIDEDFQGKLTRWLFTDEDGPEDIFMIGDEMVDEGGIKSFSGKFRGFEAMSLREMLYVVISQIFHLSK